MKNTFITLLTIILLVISPVTFAVEECPLCEAAKNNDVSEVKRLLDNGADVDNVNKGGGGGFNACAQKGHNEIVKLLLGNGANVNYINAYGETALMYAALNGHSEVVNILLENGTAITNYQNYRGKTALIFATKNGHRKVVELLLECGAETDITDIYEKNAWNYAKGKKLISAILDKHLNDVVGGHEFPPCKNENTFDNIKGWFNN